MLKYDSVMAYSKSDAKLSKVGGMYAIDKSFETVERVKKGHLKLTDDELSKLYGKKEIK